MLYLIISLVNLIIGVLSNLPKQEITVDLSVFTDYLGFINYFIPFYLIYPLFLAWMGFIAFCVTSMSVWGIIRRHL